VIKLIIDKYVNWRASKVRAGFRLLCNKLAAGEVKWVGKERGGVRGYIGGTDLYLQLNPVGYYYNLLIDNATVEMTNDEKWLFKRSLAIHSKKEQEVYDSKMKERKDLHRDRVDAELALVEAGYEE